jgi:hypothetical protein
VQVVLSLAYAHDIFSHLLKKATQSENRRPNRLPMLVCVDAIPESLT